MPAGSAVLVYPVQWETPLRKGEKMKKEDGKKKNGKEAISRKEINLFLWLLEEAYRGDGNHSLLGNLRRVGVEDWNEPPQGGGRSLASILEHVGWAKWMYQDYAFGTASLRGDRPPLTPSGGKASRPREELLNWLEEGHQLLVESVRELADDTELDKERLTNWGEKMETRNIIRIMIAHDHYHAGEINHIRALLQGDDRWRY